MPKVQSKANNDFLYLAGNFASLKDNKLVGDPWPIFNTGDKLSGYVADHLLLPVLHPNSDALVT